MNQIIYIKDDIATENIKKKKSAFRAQFFFSIIFLFIFICSFIYFRYNNQHSSDNYSSQLANNYKIYRLYANTSQEQEAPQSSIIGTIEIPKIQVSYPILSTLDERLLRIAPCRFLGDISDSSNLCIAGHNYDNDKFFSNIRYLEKNDEIIITNNSNFIYDFIVFDNYEVISSDLSPIYEVTNKYKKELTLVTCNNKNNKRIIVKAKLET